MKNSIRLFAVLATVAVLVLGNSAHAAEPQPTTITVSDIHCMGCAKTCAKHLYEIAGVAKVAANIEAKTLTITPTAQAVVSPRALWEAVEKAGKVPVKIQGPSGTFAVKPKS